MTRFLGLGDRAPALMDKPKQESSAKSSTDDSVDDMPGAAIENGVFAALAEIHERNRRRQNASNPYDYMRFLHFAGTCAFRPYLTKSEVSARLSYLIQGPVFPTPYRDLSRAITPDLGATSFLQVGPSWTCSRSFPARRYEPWRRAAAPFRREW